MERRIAPGQSRALWLLLVLCASSCVGSVVVGNLDGALLRGRQRQTMADMRSIGSAIENYQVDHGELPRVPPGPVALWLGPALAPTYIKSLPARDGWGRPFEYAVSGDEYFVMSAARDGAVDPSPKPGAVEGYGGDIYFMNGQFVRYPECSCSK